MKTQNLGYPRIGNKRELKKACEKYWSKKKTKNDLIKTAKSIRTYNWKIQKEIGIDLIPVNDFSFYDHMLDMSFLLGVIPDRYELIAKSQSEIDLYFSMARGCQKDEFDVKAMEMTKWFDTNYHYIVPEFKKNQKFYIFDKKIFSEIEEAKTLNFNIKPVIIGPLSYLFLGKEKEKNFSRIDLIYNLLPVYIEILKKIKDYGIKWIQIDEPILSTDLDDKNLEILKYIYFKIKKEIPDLKVILTSYFSNYGNNLQTILSLPIDVLHLDMMHCESEINIILENESLDQKILSLGIVDGRNIWKNNFQKSLKIIDKVVNKISLNKVWVAPSCSLLHVPCDLDYENKIDYKIKKWLAFSKQKLNEVVILSQYARKIKNDELENSLKENILIHQDKKSSILIHNTYVKNRLNLIKKEDFYRNSNFLYRQKVQKKLLKLPLLPTTTIGSFPQTEIIRNLRSKYRKKEITKFEYESELKKEIIKVIDFQNKIDLDVLVHGEFERNDMVEYFGELLNGFAFTENGWVQSYGSRCVKPPIIYGDVFRNKNLSLDWILFAQKNSKKLIKGMLTGPVTILQWSFVRNDQPKSTTAYQIALAIRDEVKDLEKEGVKIIQIDEPAIREGLPLKKKEWKEYLNWAIKSFKLSSSGVKDETQIHTHMCYSEFNDIIEHIADLDADVITIEASRSEMELLNIFKNFKYPNEIGPGIYDIHSPRIPTVQEMINLINKIKKVIPIENIWINPDCGLKTRKWEEIKIALKNMTTATKILRKNL